MTARKCDNWLETFREWSLPRSEAPESYHLWAGLFTMSSVLRRRVKIPKTILGGWEVYPTLYVIFVAPPGKARKSTTGNYAEELLGHVPGVERTATSITKEKLLSKLGEVPDSALSIFSSEFALFIQKSGMDMYDVLTDLFDGKRDISVDTLSRALDFAEKPCVNLLACTTPKWISENMPEAVIGGGFASRVIFVFEETKRRSVLYYDEPEYIVDWDKMKEMEESLINDLVHMSTLEGDFTIDREARDFMKPWYDKNSEFDDSVNSRLQGYFERKPAHIHKLAILFHLSYSDELVLTRRDFEAALATLEYIELKLPRTFESIGKNQYSTDMMDILAYIRQKEVVSKKDVLRNFYHVAEPLKLAELAQGLSDMGVIKIFLDPDDPHNMSKTQYHYSGPKVTSAGARSAVRVDRS